MAPLPMVGTAGELHRKAHDDRTGLDKTIDMGSVGRFMKSRGGVYQDYLVGRKAYAPRPGDMYNKPVPSNHIGFISDVREAGGGEYEIMSIDGNSGPPGFSPLFDMSEGRRMIGYGFIYQPPTWRKLTPDCYYIHLCND
ncbi:hypothetical protein DYH55_21330 [Methylovirgula sp. 4M-Z18]|nr:hypothetical protein DYH55_21330 [Methylovirgula sp. 4M-Z18]